MIHSNEGTAQSCTNRKHDVTDLVKCYYEKVSEKLENEYENERA